MTDVVRLESLRKTYDGPVTALDGVTIGFAAGSFTAVLGPSGSGKSTLLQCAAGPDRPTAGRVFIDGTEPTATRDAAMTKFRRRRVGFIFQDHNLLPALTVEQNVTLPLRQAGRRADGKPVRAVLALLPSVVDQYGRTVVMVTHDPAAASYADTVVSRGSMP